jgi:hypothetical protein
MVRLLILLILLSAAACAQIRGVPPSVTSIASGPDGRPVFRGVPPSVMSLGPEGFGPSLDTIKFSRRSLPVFFPAFVPVPYVLIERERIIEREVPVEIEYEQPRPRRVRRVIEEPEEEAEKFDEPQPRTERSPEPPRESQLTVLVFRDGSRSEVRNFAIVGETLLVFAPDPSRKLLLADLDLDATRTANEARGHSFVLP